MPGPPSPGGEIGYECETHGCNKHAEVAIRLNPGKVAPVWMPLCAEHAVAALGRIGFTPASWAPTLGSGGKP